MPLATLRDPRLRSKSPAWGLLLAAGAVWGLGLMRVLALEVHCTLCYGVPGAALGAVLGTGLVVAVGAPLVVRVSGPGDMLPWIVSLFLPLYDVLSGTTLPWRGPVLLLGSLGVLGLGSLRAWALSHPRRESGAWRWGMRYGPFLLAVLLPLVVYLVDVSPYVGRADTFEFQVIGPQLGIAHPSGYPLYTLISKLFSLVPVGTMAWRINLSSACFAALASGVLYLSLARGSPQPTHSPSRLLALAASWLLAFTPTLWSRAIEAEVYTLNALLVALGLWLAVSWATERISSDVAWPAFGALIGVALASHITLGALSFLAPAMLWARRREAPGGRAWAAALLLGAMGLALYAYIPLRWPAVTGGERMSLSAFLRFVTNADSGGALRPLAFYHDPGRWSLVGRLLHAQVGWVGLGLAGVGWAALILAYPAIGAGSLAAFGAWVWFNLSFYVAEPDYAAFLIPAHVVLLFWVGWGLQAARRGLVAVGGAFGGPLIHGGLQAALTVVLVGTGLRQLWVTGPTLDRVTEGRADEAWARYVLDLPLAQGGAILADSEKFPPLYYLQQIEGLRPDLEMVTLFSESQYREALAARWAEGQQVYLARYLPGMDAYGVSSLGPLIAVAPPSMFAATAPTGQVGVAFGDALVLAAHELATDGWSDALSHLTLTWQVTAPVAADLEVRLRLVDPDDLRVVWERNDGRPVRGYTATPAWQPGWVVDDYHALSWPAWLPPGTYRLEVGLFPRFEARGLPVAGTETDWHPLRVITVPAQTAALPETRSMIFAPPSTRLLAAELPGTMSSGAAVDLDLVWWCREATGDTVFDLQWVPLEDRGPLVVTPLIARGYAGATVRCGEGISGGALRPVLRRVTLTAPTEPGPYRLELSRQTGDQALRCTWLGAARERCPLETIEVVPSVGGWANYDGRLLLQEAAFDATGVPAGGPLDVILRWRALQRPERDYTVFLQVIGPDGRLYGQVDTWPVQGARPTSGWQPAEEVVDPYSFYVDTSGPSGEYTIIVGWYLLADMSRLPVVDTTGHAVGDHTTIGTFILP